VKNSQAKRISHFSDKLKMLLKHRLL